MNHMMILSTSCIACDGIACDWSVLSLSLVPSDHCHNVKCNDRITCTLIKDRARRFGAYSGQLQYPHICDFGMQHTIFKEIIGSIIYIVYSNLVQVSCLKIIYVLVFIL